MLLPTRTNLLVLGIVAQHMASKATCTAYTVAHDFGISHVTARKELTTLEAVGFLHKQDRPMLNGFHRVIYSLSVEGFTFLRNNRDLYTEVYLAFLFSLCDFE